MPVHDWNRVDAGTFHAFHTAWITHLSEALNGGVLPEGYYAMLASYLAGPQPEAYIERLSVGLPLADMPLFLNADRYVNVPLESTYNQAFRGLPAVWRQVLE